MGKARQTPIKVSGSLALSRGKIYHHSWENEQVGLIESPPPHQISSRFGHWTLFLFGLPGKRGLESSLRMHFLLYAIIVTHVVVCFFLIGVVLLQQGKSADLAGTFGGQGSQTAFGPRAAANLLTKMTAWAAGIFMVTSLSLTILYLRSSGTSSSVFSGMKSSAPVSAPAKPGK